MFVKRGMAVEKVTNEKALEICKAQEAALQKEFPKAQAMMDKLKKLSGKGKFPLDWWKYDVTKITKSEGNMSLL